MKTTPAVGGVELSADDLRAVRLKAIGRLVRWIWNIQYADTPGISKCITQMRQALDRIEELNDRIEELDTQGRLL